MVVCASGSFTFVYNVVQIVVGIAVRDMVTVTNVSDREKEVEDGVVVDTFDVLPFDFYRSGEVSETGGRAVNIIGKVDVVVVV